MALESQLSDTVVISSAFPQYNRLSSLMAVALITRPAPRHLRPEAEVRQLPPDAENSQELITAFNEIHDSLFVSEDYFEEERKRIAIEKDDVAQQLATKRSDCIEAEQERDDAQYALDETATKLYQSRESVRQDIENALASVYELTDSEVALSSARLQTLAEEGVAPIASHDYAVRVATFNRYAREEQLRWNLLQKKHAAVVALKTEISLLEDKHAALEAELQELIKDEARYVARLDRARDVITMNTRRDKISRSVKALGVRATALFKIQEFDDSHGQSSQVKLELLAKENPVND